ncbi:MAG: translation initiation factor IF-2 associated domain-containing protein, partial [Xanthobacteraceae bacterium]
MTETETKNPGDKTLKVASTKTLTLKRGVEQGVVRQSFSHGRTKPVVVEKVKRRVVGPGEAKPEPAPATAPAPTGRRVTAKAAAGATAAPATTAWPAAPAPKPSGVVLRTLTEEERSARAHALADARVREAEERKIAEEEARRRSERDVRERTEREAAEARKREEEERRRHDEETKRKAEQEAKKRFGEDEAKAKLGPLARTHVVEPEEEEAPRTTRRGGVARPAPAPKPARPGAEKRRGRLTVVTALSADEERERSVAAFRRRVQRLKGQSTG